MVSWPAIIKYSGDSELIYISDQVEWENDIDLHSSEYEETDYLLDSSGEIYTLLEKESFFINPKPNGDSKSLKEILGLVKAHATQQGSCCVAKLYAPSIIEAFKIVESLNKT